MEIAPHAVRPGGWHPDGSFEKYGDHFGGATVAGGIDAVGAVLPVLEACVAGLVVPGIAGDLVSEGRVGFYGLGQASGLDGGVDVLGGGKIPCYGPTGGPAGEAVAVGSEGVKVLCRVVKLYGCIPLAVAALPLGWTSGAVPPIAPRP